MTTLFRFLAVLGLLVVIATPINFYGGTSSPPQLKQWMLIGTVVWFVFSYLGFRQNKTSATLADAHEPVA